MGNLWIARDRHIGLWVNGVLVSKSGNWGDWVVGQWGELADFSKSCKWGELSEGVGQRWESSKPGLLHKLGKRRVNTVE